MKTKSLFLALLMFSVDVSAVGKDEPGTLGMAVIPVKGSEVFKVVYRGEAPKKLRLNIYDADAKRLYTETVSGRDGFIRPVNFSGLQYGEYTIEVVDGDSKQTEKINYQPITSSPKTIHITNYPRGEQKYTVSVSDAGEEAITVKIYDKSNNLIHTEKRDVKGSFAQVYVVKTPGAVTFEVVDEGGNVKTTRF